MLSVRITGEANGEYVCALSLEPQTQVRASDSVQHQGDLTIVVPHESVAKLNGATVDWTENRLGGGFVVINPNKPAAPPIPLPTSRHLPIGWQARSLAPVAPTAARRSLPPRERRPSTGVTV